ncbi:MAG: DUF5330 domain-containing protein [Rhizobiaceae bacterium]|nr:DUF5330 domain-containing protein [Rhizobiaceae bacterium]
MGFIIRSAFWLSLVLLLIPFGSSQDGQMVNPLQAMFAAKGAIEDIAGMCERKPDVCAVGRAAVHTISVRAREGARIAYQAFDADGDDAGSPDETADQIGDMIARSQAEAIVTGSVEAGSVDIVPTPAVRR